MTNHPDKENLYVRKIVAPWLKTCEKKDKTSVHESTASQTLKSFPLGEGAAGGARALIENSFRRAALI
jgi:hypothetical protein